MIKMLLIFLKLNYLKYHYEKEEDIDESLFQYHHLHYKLLSWRISNIIK